MGEQTDMSDCTSADMGRYDGKERGQPAEKAAKPWPNRTTSLSLVRRAFVGAPVVEVEAPPASNPGHQGQESVVAAGWSVDFGGVPGEPESCSRWKSSRSMNSA